MRLVLDTSSLNISIGLWHDGQWLYHLDHVESKFQQSKKVLRLVLEALQNAQLKPAQIEEVAVGIGPGSYTGLRVGLTVGKVWAYSMKIPLYSFSSSLLLQRTRERKQEAEYPSVQFLEAQDFQQVDRLSHLEPVYENDHFS